jgi:predicted small lipoprotein YifL
MPHSLSGQNARTAPPAALALLRAALLVALLSGIGACGNRGPLYLPDAEAPAEASPPTPTEQDKQEAEKRARAGTGSAGP